MNVHLRLEPLGRILDIEPGTPLRDVLFGYGVEFPCGGRGRCRRCRVRVLEGAAPSTADERQILGEDAVAAGWRLACRMEASGGLALEVAQWDSSVLGDDSAFPFTPRDGFGVAVDIGTTTLVAQLIDLRAGSVAAVRSSLNPQAAHGADVMTRLQLALSPTGRGRLRDLVRVEIGRMIAEMVAEARPRTVPGLVTLVGNTVMQHLFCDLDVAPLATAPFVPVERGPWHFRPRDLGWDLDAESEVCVLPGLGGFVGSDIRAGITAAKLAENDSLVGLIDLGTNGEIVLGTRARMLCTSAAAGPAFEGGRISCGMRAATGAISEVTLNEGQLECHVLGRTAARGICGSGLVDAVACGLELGQIRPDGRLASGRPYALTPSLSLTQADIREVQLAKAAIAGGVRILLKRLDATPGDVRRMYVAGAFGNYINRESACRIGLLEFSPEVIEPAGNTALLGAKLALFETQGAEFPALNIEHVPLATDPEFQDAYVDAMRFP